MTSAADYRPYIYGLMRPLSEDMLPDLGLGCRRNLLPSTRAFLDVGEVTFWIVAVVPVIVLWCCRWIVRIGVVVRGRVIGRYAKEEYRTSMAMMMLYPRNPTHTVMMKIWPRNPTHVAMMKICLRYSTDG
jgi:hypothetical protein